MQFILMILFSFPIGILFGLALEKGRVFEPGLIVGQMQMKRFTMVKVFFTAIATGMLAIALMRYLGWVSYKPESYPYIQSIVGGLLLGIGITLSGACPGTVMAQIGAGYKDAIFTTLGGIFGAIFFFLVKGKIPFLFKGEAPKSVTFDTLFSLPYWAIALIFAFGVTIFLIVLERYSKWKKDLGKDGTGL